uniref:Uncharacterized protein MANES_17G084000 n=1 Tax=Rhizophora mucronata TaxID=61149 RepID=A0A2P2KND6_RHIMU
MICHVIHIAALSFNVLALKCFHKLNGELLVFFLCFPPDARASLIFLTYTQCKILILL